jgi:hypothetical protein
MSKKREYVEYNERTDVIASVQLVANLVGPLKRQSSQWKWVVIGAHNAHQGAMVCNLSGTDRTGALTVRSRKKMLEFYEEDNEDSPIPDEWLAPFETLLEWIQDRKRIVGGVSWHPNKPALKKLKLLHYIRNELSHYVPMSWSITVTGLPDMVNVALDGTEHLMLKAQCVLIHLTGNQKRALERALADARTGLALL